VHKRKNLEHLTEDELEQLEDFVQQLEHWISIHWYGLQEEHNNEYNAAEHLDDA
jgi:uncharacterized membrane-anchored protein